MESNFVWVDLSTFNVGKASAFYGGVFQWEFAEDSGYTRCSTGDGDCAGLYEMPEFFQKIRMPSFWMTYISVSDVKAVAAKAEKLGGKVELTEDNAMGKIVLIRDPAGAGFTCYEGNELAARKNFSRTGSWCWTELMVSDLGLVREFYTGLFGWEIEEESKDRYAIKVGAGEKIGAIQVASKEEKGEKEFWAVYFAAPKSSQVEDVIRSAGGTVAESYEHEYGTQVLAYDDQGAAFFLMKGRGVDLVSGSEMTAESIKWRSLIGLVAIYLIILFDQSWGWGALFLFWVVPDLKSGKTYFIEPLSRRSNPVLYWWTWLALSGYSFWSAF